MDINLCKAKRTDNGEWIEGYLYRLSELNKPFIMLPNSKGKSHQVEPETVCKATGKEYMNGEAAYQGDIFESQSCGMVMVLKYGTFEAYCPADKCFMDGVGFYAEAKGYPQMPIGDLQDYAVKIGNVFDNPELIK